MWQVTLWSVRGIAFNLHHAAWIVAACLIADLRSRSIPWGDAGLWVVTLLGCLIGALYFQCYVARLLGLGPLAVTLYPGGGYVHTRKEPSTGAALLVSLARPLFLFTAGSLVLALFSHPLAITLGYANIALAALNFLPISPLTGSGILQQAFRALRVGAATSRVAYTGIAASLLLAVLGLAEANPTLAIWAALLLAVNARQAMLERLRLSAVGLVAADLMIPASRLDSFQHGASIEDAVERALKSFQYYFPVLLGTTVTGAIDRDTLLQAAASGETNDYVPSLMLRNPDRVTPETPATEMLEAFSRHRLPFILVVDKETLVGMVVEEELVQLLLLRARRTDNIAHQYGPVNLE